MSGREAGSDAVQWEEARRWFAQAEEDFHAARACLGAQPQVVGAAAFHCQQAIEKTLKGLLIASRQKAGKTHNLMELLDSAAGAFASLVDEFDWIRPVNAWYVAARYPDVEQERRPTATDVSAALKRARQLWEQARSLDPTRSNGSRDDHL
jgi:HEPN domain-containing protein